MSDPLRTDSARALDGVSSESERHAKIEQLLLAGLDHYLSAEYEQAINVWTRILFLDRAHARARAYIERARSALSERQREHEELLQRGIDAFHRGQADEARRMLKEAIAGGAPADEAFALLERLDRLERGGPVEPLPPKPAGGVGVAAPPRVAPPRRHVPLWVGIAAVGAATAMFAVATAPTWRSLFSSAPAQGPIAPNLFSGDPSLPIPRRGEMALARAQSLAASGRLRDALTTLDFVKPTDPQKSDADRLRATIQRELLRLAAPAEPDEDGTPGRHP